MDTEVFLLNKLSPSQTGRVWDFIHNEVTNKDGEQDSGHQLMGLEVVYKLGAF